MIGDRPAPCAGSGGTAVATEDRLRRFATIWSRAIYPVTATSMTRAEFEQHLLPLARQLSETRCTPQRFDPRGAAGSAPHWSTRTAPTPRRCPASSASSTPTWCSTAAPGLDLRRRRDAGPAAPGSSTRSPPASPRRCANAPSPSRSPSPAPPSPPATRRRARCTPARPASARSSRAPPSASASPTSTATSWRSTTRSPGCSAGSSTTSRSRKVTEWAHPEDAAARLASSTASWSAANATHYQVEKPFSATDGTVLWTNLTVSLLRDADGRPQYQLALLEDITERRLLHVRLRHEATHDALTGLPNRTLFFERLEKALVRRRPAPRFGLCYLDLDGFKAVNDSLGHAVGRPAAGRGRRPAAGLRDRARRDGGPARRRRVRRPDHRTRRAEPRSPNWPPASSPRSSTPVRLDGRELTVRGSIGIVRGPGRRPRPRRGAAQRRHHHVPGQVARAATATSSPTPTPTPAPSPGTG